MSDDLVKVTVSDGKYTFVQRADGSCYALRYDEPWRENIFDGMTLAMAHRIEELEAKLEKAVDALEGIVTDDTWGLEHATYMKCRAALAELKGESHE